MPFTLSHPAAVLPLVRWGLPPSALGAGAVAPDVPYYLLPSYRGWPTHESWAVLCVDLALGLAVLTCFHVLWKPACVALAPSRLRGALVLPALGCAGPRREGRRGWGLLVAAVLAGAATHVAWDAFTHADGQVAGRVEVLREPLAGQLPAYRVLQHASTVVGAVVLAAWARRWAASAPRRPVPTWLHLAPARCRRWRLVVTGAALLVGAVRAASAAGPAMAPDAVEGVVLGTALALAVASLLLTRAGRKQDP